MEKTIMMYNNRYNTQLSLSDFTDYDIFKDLPYDEAEKLIALWYEEELWNSLEPRCGSQRGVKKLVDDGHDVYFATATHPKNFAWKVEWLQHYFGMVQSKNIICICNKGLLNCDVLIDDCVDNLLANKLCYRVLFNCCWNQHVNDDVHLITRVHNWDEIIEVVNEICKE
jgi:5'(3')-deoxyribonucleotidase